MTLLLLFPPSNLFYCHRLVLLYSKTPKQVFFNHINIFDTFTTLYLLFYNYTFFVLTSKIIFTGYFITQPGSTVATSLIEGEACKKHCGVLDIRGNEFRLEPLPMKKVRPFKMNEIYLNELPELDTIGK